MLLTTLIAILLLTAANASAADSAPLKATFTAMGGIPINLSAWGLDQPEFEQVTAAITARIEELEGMISTYRPDSAVSRLNRGETLAETPPDLSFLVFVSRWISSETAGTFDITVKPLVELWRTCRNEQRLPAQAEYEAALANVGYFHLSVALDGSINFDQPGVMLDLGGIAKGFFADEAVRLLREAGATRCLADVGGDIVTWQAVGEQVEPFRMGIRHPFGGDELYGVLELDTGSVVTSGDYERYYEIGGKRYCHIFDPRSGEPVSGVHSVTVTAERGIDADAYATAIFVMGLDVGSRFIERHPELEAVIIADNPAGELVEYVSPGLSGRVQFNPAR
jgi:thiamine biosynthesis lipoprotein